LNEVIQPMVGSNAVLALWAGGTANVVARDIHLPSDIRRLADIIAAGKTQRIALGLAEKQVTGDRLQVTGEAHRIEYKGQIKEESGVTGSPLKVNQAPPVTCHLSPVTLKRYFFMFAGIGLDASIARGVNRKLKRKAGEFAFWVSGVKHLFSWQADTFTVEVEGKKYESAFTLIGNGKSYGGNITMAKNARLEDAEFEVFILPRHAHNLRYLIALVKCYFGKPETSGATIVKSSRVQVDSTSEIWVELDGELAGTLPMTFEVVPDALSVIVP
jgi:diacylglycerol kinase family enzyme